MPAPSGRQALVLLPEIALSSQWLERFERRFGVRAGGLALRPLARAPAAITWRAVADGARARCVVGARSALFLPFPDLGLVVVDEEHETAFKQEEGVVYHARDMAVVRARLCRRARRCWSPRRPAWRRWPTSRPAATAASRSPTRHGGAALPEVAAIDLRDDAAGARAVPRPAADRRGARDAGARRAGDAVPQPPRLRAADPVPRTAATGCSARTAPPGWSSTAPAGSCNATIAATPMPIPPLCPACGAAHSLTPVGPGVERITEEAAALFPDARRLVMASDTLPGPHAAAEAARAIEAREVDLIIGTQIVAKGWHFPHLTLVGVVDADLGLAGGDLRAAERTVQLLHQVAGRAGRAEAPGRVLLQTFSPEHPVMQALVAGDLGGVHGARGGAAAARPLAAVTGGSRR